MVAAWWRGRGRSGTRSSTDLVTREWRVVQAPPAEVVGGRIAVPGMWDRQNARSCDMRVLRTKHAKLCARASVAAQSNA